MNAARRAFDPTHPIAVALATLCVVLAVLDIYWVVSFSFSGGPWDSLDDPVVTLATMNEYEARVLHDESLCALDPLMTVDFKQSAEDAKQSWNDLRDEGLEIQAIDDGNELNLRRDAAVARFAPDAKVEPLPTLSRVALIIAGNASFSTLVFAVGWLGAILWKRARGNETRFPSTLSLPVAGAWYGVIAFLYAFIALDAVMWGIAELSFQKSWIGETWMGETWIGETCVRLFTLIGSAAMVVAIPVIVGVAWLLCSRPNGTLLGALGFVSRLAQMNVRSTLAMIVAVIGLDSIVLILFSLVQSESSQSNFWWESLDEVLMFGSPGAALLTALDAIVGAPVVEEIIFRGLLFGGLYGRWGFWPAALGSSLLFASVHGYGWEGSVSVIVTGTFLCWLYARTGRLWAPMLAHGLLNAMVFLPQFAIRELVHSI